MTSSSNALSVGQQADVNPDPTATGFTPLITGKQQADISPIPSGIAMQPLIRSSVEQLDVNASGHA